MVSDRVSSTLARQLRARSYSIANQRLRWLTSAAADG
jgi:hypothetical protein